MDRVLTMTLPVAMIAPLAHPLRLQDSHPRQHAPLAHVDAILKMKQPKTTSIVPFVLEANINPQFIWIRPSHVKIAQLDVTLQTMAKLLTPSMTLLRIASIVPLEKNLCQPPQTVQFARPEIFKAAVQLLQQPAKHAHRVNTFSTRHKMLPNISLATFAKNLVTNTFPKQNHALFVVEVATKTKNWMTFIAKYAHPTHSLRTMPSMKIITILFPTV
jgi:hypothetical protein